MSFSAINTISFDATGTLFDPFPSIGAIYGEILQNHGIFLPEPELDMRFMAEYHKCRSHSPGVINESVEKLRWQEVVQGILQEDYSTALFEALWDGLGRGDHWKPKPRLRRTLGTLKEKGYRLIITSNWDRRLHRILSDLDLGDFFEHVFISSELGVEKPSEKVFSLIREQLDVKPDTLLHIGNSATNDFLPALRAGWNALLLHNRIPYGMEPGSVLGSVDQLPEALESEKVVNP